MKKSASEEIHSEAFLHRMMQRQLKLSITCAAIFLIAVLSLPLFNYYFPELMATSLGGFTLSWLILGILFFPLVWIISYFFIRRSMIFEKETLASIKRE
ncbi:MAG: DUF485 domain-containing protein [Verrucomicrobiae bacterium]|nr:DUF485 domain-containing protein [Verrucomicrobiae bacterium]